MVETEPALAEILGSPLDRLGTTVPYKIERTGPDVLLRHDISDEELEKLADTKRDYLWEGKWVALGVCLGAVKACFDALSGAYISDPSVPLAIGGLIQVVIFFASAAAFGILWHVMKRKTSAASDLATAIRERTAKQV